MSLNNLKKFREELMLSKAELARKTKVSPITIARIEDGMPCRLEGYTLDIDATGIAAEKESAKMTYKGYTGYMPIVGHLAENGLIWVMNFVKETKLLQPGILNLGRTSNARLAYKN